MTTREIKINDTLWADSDHLDENWDMVDNTLRINLNIVGECDDLTSQERATIPIEYHILDSTATICGDSYSCVVDDNRGQYGGHYDYRWAYVYLNSSHMAGTGIEYLNRHTINHETGHVFGLADPTPGPAASQLSGILLGLEKADKCRVEVSPGSLLWVDSIMHAPPSYCDDYGEWRAWPTQADRDVVGGIINKP